MPQPTRPIDYRTSSLIAGALPAGVLLFWLIGWFVTQGGRVGLASVEGMAPRLAFWIWGISALGALAAALALRARVVRAVDDARGREGRVPPGLMAQLHPTLMIAWALLEAPALMAGVFFLLLAAREILWPAAVLYLLGVALTFPRPEWFGTE